MSATKFRIRCRIDEIFVSKLIDRSKREIAYYRALIAHSGTPPAARWMIGGALAYLLSPIDLIPDWIPILGYLDDLLMVPVLIYGASAIIPASVKKECREMTAKSATDGNNADEKHV